MLIPEYSKNLMIFKWMATKSNHYSKFANSVDASTKLVSIRKYARAKQYNYIYIFKIIFRMQTFMADIFQQEPFILFIFHFC